MIELLVVISIIALLVSILLPALAQARRAARHTICQSNMHQLGVAHHSYAADFKDFIAAFNGRAGVRSPAFPTLIDCAEQALRIVREHDPQADEYARIGGRFTVFSSDLGLDSHGAGMQVITEQHSHLVLTGYMGDKVIMPTAVCPEDQPRITWRTLGIRTITSSSNAFKPAGSYQGNDLRWTPYSSSYQLLPAGWLKEKKTLHKVFNQGSRHDRYDYLKSEPLGQRRLSEVSFTSGKVAVADSLQRHTDKFDLYFGYARARQPLLFWDSSVSVRRTGDANVGWNRMEPHNGGSMKFEYVPDSMYEPPVPSDGPRIEAGYYKWTREGLRGVDFGSTEIRTVKQ